MDKIKKMIKLLQPKGLFGIFPEEYIKTKTRFISWWLGARCQATILIGRPNIFGAYWGCWN
jgi:hypothetical protein